MTNPFVSVKTITYNHEKFIAQCIEGILMQETNFSFEYIIGEDCSTDRTMEIVQEYAAKFPNIIRVITDDKNVGAVENDNRTDRACRGKYVAFCEGDDFWTDPYKLQKEVDFLEANPEVGLVHTSFSYLNEGKRTKDVWKHKHIPQGDILDHLISGNYIATATVCMRNEYLKKIRIANQIKENQWRMGDYPLWIEVSAQTKIAFIPEDTMTYRVHPDSATHSLDWNGDYKFFESRYRIKKFYAEKYKRDNLIPLLDKMYHRELLKYAIFLKDEEMRNTCSKYFVNKGMGKELLYYLFAKFSFLDTLFEFIYTFKKRYQTLH
ncbi:glycosyltransferase [Ancylomarina longa]|uniref:Glycosyltransferase n=1 Tax=Ancylomarina longa TaxID=2487017 RepID=A0A434AU33_9BACT|nr:glycosyltransferase [Ancylomarina longa]RUT77872.1 glycosyltransferase [Ancylomarina longa]